MAMRGNSFKNPSSKKVKTRMRYLIAIRVFQMKNENQINMDCFSLKSE